MTPLRSRLGCRGTRNQENNLIITLPSLASRKVVHAATLHGNHAAILHCKHARPTHSKAKAQFRQADMVDKVFLPSHNDCLSQWSPHEAIRHGPSTRPSSSKLNFPGILVNACPFHEIDHLLLQSPRTHIGHHVHI